MVYTELYIVMTSSLNKRKFVMVNCQW